jgi:large subunit ribosomal protein L35
MPKLKTHKATARRFQVTGSGRLLRTRHGKSHLRRNRSDRAKREYDEMQTVAAVDVPRVRLLLPYAKKYKK